MNRGLAVGVAVTLAGLVGYAAGILAPYPGRALSLTVIMVGVTLSIVSNREEVAG